MVLFSGTRYLIYTLDDGEMLTDLLTSDGLLHILEVQVLFGQSYHVS